MDRADLLEDCFERDRITVDVGDDGHTGDATYVDDRNSRLPVVLTAPNGTPDLPFSVQAG